jgi:hypothetical protein
LRATPADTAGDKRGDTSGDKAGNGDGDAHPRLIEEFERRLRFDARMSQGETDTAARGMHFEAWLQALEASRRHLVSLHRQERLHDDVLHAIEAELDLEELRIKAMLEQVRD